MLRAGVPETSVDEYSDLAGGEHNVWADFDTVRQAKEKIFPVAVPHTVQSPPQRDLRLGVRSVVGLHVSGPSRIERSRVDTGSMRTLPIGLSAHSRHA